MKLSTETIQILKNFASINPNIVIDAGSKLKTIAESKTVMASADIVEDIPEQIGIYDLNEFLNVINLFDEPTLEFDGSTSVTVKSGDGKQSVGYYFSDPDILTSPAKEVKLPSVDYSFNLSTDNISTLRRAASTLGVSDLVVSIEGTKASAVVTDLGNSTANSFKLDLGDAENSDGENASIVFNITNLKLIVGDYKVDVSKKLISELTSTSNDIKYWVALEKSSKIGE